MEDFYFGLGVTAFALDSHLNSATLDRLLDDVDKLGIPLVNRNAIEVLVAHNPEAGIDLDDSERGYLKWAAELGQKMIDHDYEVVVCGFHPPGSPHMLSEKEDEVDHAVKRVQAMLAFASEQERVV